MDLVPIMLDNYREQVCEVSIHSISLFWRDQLIPQKPNQNFLSLKGGINMQNWDLRQSC
jgi:hypothetical protein